MSRSWISSQVSKTIIEELSAVATGSFTLARGRALSYRRLCCVGWAGGPIYNVLPCRRSSLVTGRDKPFTSPVERSP